MVSGERRGGVKNVGRICIGDAEDFKTWEPNLKTVVVPEVNNKNNPSKINIKNK